MKFMLKHNIFFNLNLTSCSFIFYHSASTERYELPDLQVLGSHRSFERLGQACQINHFKLWYFTNLEITAEKTCRGRWLILHDFAAGLAIQHSNYLACYNLVWFPHRLQPRSLVNRKLGHIRLAKLRKGDSIGCFLDYTTSCRVSSSGSGSGSGGSRRRSHSRRS